MHAKDLRKSHKEKRQPCFICGKHKYITQLHHILPLKDAVKYVENNKYIKITRIWLCPNHHVYLHKLKQVENKYKKIDGIDIHECCFFLNEAINKKQHKKYLKIIKMEKEDNEKAFFESLS